MILGIVGFIGSGKGTVGDVLVSKFNFQRVAFVDNLKDAVVSNLWLATASFGR
jgi:dephospho-CoA kinase